MGKSEVRAPGCCPHCSNFMNWSREWANLWRCGGCGRIIKVGEAPSTRQVVEGAVAAARDRSLVWERPLSR